MQYENNEKMKMVEKSNYYLIMTLVIIVLFFISSDAFGPTGINSVNAKSQNHDLPKYGWIVCEDLGIGPVPGYGNQHRLRLCNQSNWEVLAFCLQPGRTTPPIGTVCSMTTHEIFWCVGDVQRLKLYETIIEPTPTPTMTITTTAIPTYTSTPTEIPTEPPTLTPTSIQTITITPTSRDRLGGNVNVETTEIGSLLFGIFVIICGITTALIDWKKITR